jgi:hypothetical protein
MTCLYFSKQIPCLLTKAPLRYAIVCSMKNLLELSCGDLFKVIIFKPLTFLKLCQWSFSPTRHFCNPFASAWLKVGHSKVCGDNC